MGRRRWLGPALGLLATGCLSSPPSSGEADAAPDGSLCQRPGDCTFGDDPACLCGRCVHNDPTCDPGFRRYATRTGPDGECVPAPVDISAGLEHSCAVWSDGHASCWGYDCVGQLGDQPEEPACEADIRTVPAPVTTQRDGPSLDRIVQIAASYVSTCAQRDDGEVWCWGSNAYGSLGTTAVPVGSNGFEPAPVMTDSEAVLGGMWTIASNGFHACALDVDEFYGGFAWCWGPNVDGVLGNSDWPGGGATRLAGKAVTSDRLYAVAAGSAHNCAIHVGAREVTCWGRNNLGQIGCGNGCGAGPVPTETAVLLEGEETPLSNGWQLTSGSNFSCALAGEPQALWCWGDNHERALGDEAAPTSRDGQNALGARRNVLDPDEGGGIVELGAGDFFACARLANDSVWCWGSNAFGQLGADPETTPYSAPRAVTSDASAMSIGMRHACVLSNDARVFCWGDNSRGQLGDGTTSNRSEPTEVIDLCPP